MRSRRDVLLDMIRGLSLVVMTIDHLPLPFLQHFTFQPFGFFSAAHPFFFLSGWIAGTQLGRLHDEKGAREMARTARQRAGKIYLYHVATVIFIAVCIALHRDPEWRKAFPLFYERPLIAAVAGIFLVHLPWILVVLPCYFWFFVAVPIVLKQLAAGRTGLVVAASATLFGLAQWGFFMPPEDLHRIYTGYFNLAGWQAVFFGGVMLGNWRRKHPAARIVIPRAALFAVGGILAFLFAVRHLRSVVASLSFLQTMAAVQMFAPGWLSVLNFALFVLVCTALSDRIRQWIPGSTWGRALAFLGMHPLQVFTWHIVLWMGLLPFDGRLRSCSAPVQILVGLVATLSLFIPALIRSEYLSRVRRKPRMVPAFAASE